VLCALGIFGALALYTPATGVLGSGLAVAAGALVGMARYLLPLLLLSLGWLSLRERRPRKSRRPRSQWVGWALVGIAGFTFLDIAGGRPSWSATAADLSEAGGFVGVAIGGTLETYTGPWGEVVIAVTMVAVAVVLLTSLSFTAMAEALARWSRPVGRGLRTAWSKVLAFAWPDGTSERPAWVRRPLRAGRTTEPATEPAPVDGPHDDIGVPPELFDSESYIDLRRDAPPVEPEPVPAGPVERREPVIEVPEPKVVDGLEIAWPQPPEGSTWQLPSLDLLERSEAQEVDRASVEATGRQLEHALAEHGVETRLIGVVVGPTVSRFELELGPGVKVARVTSLHKDIAYAMATPDVRILAPIPGKQAIGIEVPNVRRQIVAVGDLLVSEEAARSTHPLEVTLGRDISGRTVMVNLARMPHILVAGQTGSGKSSCINSMLTSILMRATPDQVRLILVDPKRVELTQYTRLPHLLTEVVTDPKKAANALSWAVREMERRYDLLSEVGVRDIDGYNAGVDEDRLPTRFGPDGQKLEFGRLSYILIILDELADLMMVAARDVEESICRIAQKARAVGIHLVIATQRPSINVITGLIKANVPARLAFAVSSLTDSRVILDAPGAERLVGRGDGLLSDGTTGTPARFQGAWVTEAEVQRIVDVWRDQAPEVVFDSRVLDEEAAEGAAGAIPGGTTGDEDDDDLLVQAMELIVRSQLGSTSMLQRKLRVGFARAGRLMDLLEQRGVVGPSVGSKAREVLLSPEDLDAGNWPAAMRAAATSTATEPSGPLMAPNRHPAPAPAPPAMAPPPVPAAPSRPSSGVPVGATAEDDGDGDGDDVGDGDGGWIPGGWSAPSADQAGADDADSGWQDGADDAASGWEAGDEDIAGPHEPAAGFHDDGSDPAFAPPPGWRLPD
jgi:DNA segregation ATPase FtsK/SpoIIIE, S-DNA-T family